MSGIDGGGSQGLDYSDFEIEISAGDGREYPVTVHSPEGERRATMRFPFGQGELRERLKDIQIAVLRSSGLRRRVQSPEDRSVQDFGEALFEAVFAGDIRSAFDLSRRRAQQDGNGLRVRLRVDDPVLAALPWELLYDPREAEFLSLSRATPIVRFPAVPRALSALPVTLPLRALGMIASPDGLPPLNVDRERRRMEEALAPLVGAGGLELEWVPGQTWRDLQRAMQQGPWHVFHFIGHGRFDATADEGIVSLSGDYGTEHRLRATQLARALADQESLRLVVLNSCEGATGSSVDVFSGTASVLVRRGIPAVVAMQFEISDVAAVEFARSFYESVARGWPVDAAVTEARKAISFNDPDSVEWGTPVLYLRSESGRLFDMDRTIAPSVTPPPAAVDRPTIEAPRGYESGLIVGTPGELTSAIEFDERLRDIRTPESPPPPPRRSRRGQLVAAVLAVVAIAAALIFVLARGGGEEPNPSPPASPGATVVPPIGGRELVAVTLQSTHGDRATLALMDPRTGSIQETELEGTDPRWIPGGRLALNRSLTKPLDPFAVVVGPEDVGPQSDLTNIPRDAARWDWSTRDELALILDNGCICRRAASGGPISTVLAPGSEAGQPTSVAWAPNGRWIAFTGRDDRLFIVHPDGTGLAEVFGSQVIGYAWSPDGSQIVFAGLNADNGTPDLFVANADAPDPSTTWFALAPTTEWESFPTWSGDGEEIYYVHQPDAGDPTEIWAIGADGGSAGHRVTGGIDGAQFTSLAFGTGAPPASSSGPVPAG